jgi:hypothetical protein
LADEGSSGCLSCCLLLLAGLALLFLLLRMGSLRLGPWWAIALGALFLCRLLPGVPRRWFGPPVLRRENEREFWVVLAAGALMLAGGAVELWMSVGVK